MRNLPPVLKSKVFLVLSIGLLCSGIGCRNASPEPDNPGRIDPVDTTLDPATLMWYDTPAEKWEDALPVGNGRLGAMVFGKYGEEQIQLNEETYWSGGPYSTVVKGGYQFCQL